MEGKNWINKLDDLDGEKPTPRPKKKSLPLDLANLDENMPLYALGGAVAVIFILVIILFFRTGGDAPAADLQDVYNKLERLETQLSMFENREEERQKAFVQFMQSEQDTRVRLDSQRETLDDLRQKLAALEKATQSPAQATAARRQEEPRPETRTAATAEQNRIIHEVQRGENLYRIGLQYNISVERLQQLNNLSPADSIHPGQKLVVGTKNN